MFAELSTLLETVGSESDKSEYVRAVVEDNTLGKNTIATRRLSAQRLSELYGLDRSIPIFRMLRRLWDFDRSSQPLLALLSGLARDPLLRATTPSILALREGQSFDRGGMGEALRKHAGSRLNPSIIEKVLRNAAASWTQSGHLEGRTFKKRCRVQATPASTTMALFLGYLQGLRGPGLLKTQWCEVLDSPPESLARLASNASMSGLLRFRLAGEVMEIAFPDFLTRTELEETTHGQD